MCDTAKTQNSRERLADRIQNSANDGDDIHEYPCDVFCDNATGIKRGHRLQAACLLITYGQLGKSALKALRRLAPALRRQANRDQSTFDSNLAQIIEDGMMG